MKRRFANCLVIVVGVLALACMLTLHTGAQQRTGDFSVPGYSGKAHAKALPEGGPAPRLADGHPDLSGVWFSGLLGTEDATLIGSYGAQDPTQRAFDPKVTPEEKPSFQPSAAAKMKQMMSNLDEKTLRAYEDVTAGAPGYDKLPKATQLALLDNEILKLSRNCMPHGVPGAFLGGGKPVQLVSTPGLFLELIESNHDYRVVPTDGRAHTQDPDPAFNGEGVGRWEGDTLVIDTIAIDERVWNNTMGWFHSDQEHVIERITRPSLNYLVYQVTIEDPKVLAKPWTSVPRRWSLGHEALEEWYCGVNGHGDEEIQALRQQRKRLEEQK